VVAHTANPMLTGFTLPKLLWVRDNEPQNFERVKKFLLPKDYVRFMLTGEHATEVSDASGTGLLDVVTRRWSREMVERLKLDNSLLPGLKESIEVTGGHRRRGRGHRVLKEGTPVVGGAGDQAASGIGNGIVGPGVVPARWAPRASCSPTSTGPSTTPRPRPHLLPRRPRQVARHGRHPRRGPEPAVVPQPVRARAPNTTR
jgi:sugar (pentulose or hexulose) kinase